jgi:hypothetical protein
VPHLKLHLIDKPCAWCGKPLPRIRSHSLLYHKVGCRDAAEKFRRKADPVQREARRVYDKQWRDNKKWNS